MADEVAKSEVAKSEEAPDRREDLRRLWAAILRLPSTQRTAFLLGLRDERGQGVIALFPVAGVASIRRIAEAIGLDALSLAALWKELPLDDAAIAARLRVAPELVPRLRRTARQQLGAVMRKVPR